MALFNKKACDICGGPIGLLGNRKLQDGNMCKDCASRLSPFFSERRQSSIAEINDHLAYREANKEAVASFNTTRTLGLGTKVYLDEGAGKFMVSSARRLQDENPDVLDFSQVTGCVLDVEDSRSEQMTQDREGKRVSYRPPRYTYSYDFNMVIQVNHPWFNEIKFKVNNSSITSAETTGGPEEGRRNNDYRECEALGREIKNALTQIRRAVREETIAAAAPKTAQTCPLCGATTIPDAQGCCEYCGGAMEIQQQQPQRMQQPMGGQRPMGGGQMGGQRPMGGGQMGGGQRPIGGGQMGGGQRPIGGQPQRGGQNPRDPRRG